MGNQVTFWRLFHLNTLERVRDAYPRLIFQPNFPHFSIPLAATMVSKMIELIDEEAENELKNSIRERCQRIVNLATVKSQLTAVLKSIADGPKIEEKFALLNICTFIFASGVAVFQGSAGQYAPY